jgi:hypothetical protein
MKEYFTIYLPVKEEIKEFERAHVKEEIDIVDEEGRYRVTVTTSDHLSFLFKDKKGYHFCIKKLHGSGSSGILLQVDDFVKVELFVCSRNIEIGDEYTSLEWELGGKVKLVRTGDKPSDGMFKIMGKVSEGALFFVKEKQEFDESQLWYMLGGRSIRVPISKLYTEKKEWRDPEKTIIFIEGEDGKFY